MRLFIGLRPAPEIRSSIAKGFQHLRQISEVSWVPEENLHLTLAFLGEVDAGLLPDVQRAIAVTAEQSQPMQLSYAEAAGVFPGWHSPRVVWLGSQTAGKELTLLHAKLWHELKPLGFLADNRFHPHITLGRVKRQLAPDDLGRMQQARWAGQVEAISEISLFESVLRPQGPLYRVLFSHALQ